MKIEPALARGTLERRYKRFLADVATTAGGTITMHCPNTGAMLGCAEPGSEAWYSDSANPARKYRHTLEVVVGTTGIAGVNTARANRLIEEALVDGTLPPFADCRLLRTEAPIPDESGRFDFLVEDATATRCYLEVKNMTLCDGSGRGSFPDAVSVRALKHVAALRRRLAVGERAALVFCVQHTGIRVATLADEIHPEYGAAVRNAVAEGLEVYAFGCRIAPDEISIDAEVPLDLAVQRR